jgi:transposase InsO family protein
MCRQKSFEPPRKEPCQLGKQTCGSHPTSNSVCPAPLDLLHVDVLEMPVESRQHFKYLLGVVVDHSRLACVAGLKTKGAAADSLCSLILRLERQRERQVKIMRSDMGREFLGGDLQGWFKGRGIEHQTTAGYASQSNGFAERFLRTLQDGIRALLSESGLGAKFWCYAAYHCTRIYNRLPHSSLDCTPWQACFNTAQDLSNVRVFGCRAFVHNPHAKQANKLSTDV